MTFAALAVAFEAMTAWEAITLAMTVVSVIVQQMAAASARDRQRKMQEDADARADAAKGMQLVTEGEASALRIPYGRNLLGGARVYHRTADNYIYGAVGSNGTVFSSIHTVTAETQGIPGWLHLAITANTAGTFTIANHPDEVYFHDLITKIESGTLAAYYAGTPTGAIPPFLVALDTAEDTHLLTSFYLNQGLAVPAHIAALAAQWAQGYEWVAPPADSFTESMGGSLTGNKHEFLYIQQAICFAGINAVYAVDVDGKSINGEFTDYFDQVIHEGDPLIQDTNAAGMYSSNGPNAKLPAAPFTPITWPTFDSVAMYAANGVLPAGLKKVNYYDHGCRVHVYPGGSITDPMVVANDASRSTARFTNTAYASCVYRLNREDPQYTGGVPNSQFYVEGMKVRPFNVGGASLSATKIYSNNPVLCLIDYLTNTVYGRGLADSKLDLASMYAAYLICETVVEASVPIEGNLWRAKGGTRAIKLYECNLALESTKTIRENIELILETMGMAELVWSGGTYKLNLKYPKVYTAIGYAEGSVVQYTVGDNVGLFRRTAVDAPAGVHVPTVGVHWTDAIDGYITDDDIIREGETSISWPNAQSRLNYATVRFLNESKDFTEDSASWPPKIPTSGTVYADFLAEDSGQPLETDAFATGVTTYYGALAKAEQLVRSSRHLVTYGLAVNRDKFAYEPGDIVKVTSDVLNIPGELVRIEDVKPESSGVIKLSAIKFDAAQLEWNAKDDEIVPVRNLYNRELPNVNRDTIVFTADTSSNSTILSTGRLTWTAINDVRVAQYLIKTTTVVDSVPVDSWIDRGHTTTASFDMPELIPGTYAVAVVPVMRTGQSPKVNWAYQIFEVKLPPDVGVFSMLVTGDAARQFNWPTSALAKVKAYEIRYNTGPTRLAWDLQTVLVTGLPTTGYETRDDRLAPTAAAPVNPAGEFFFSIKAIGFSGLYSANASSTAKKTLAEYPIYDFTDIEGALTALSDIANDNYITPVEKRPLISEVDSIREELLGVNAQMTAKNLGGFQLHRNYYNAYTALFAYLEACSPASSWDDVSSNTTLTVAVPGDVTGGASLRRLFNELYLARTIAVELLDLDEISLLAKIASSLLLHKTVSPYTDEKVFVASVVTRLATEYATLITKATSLGLPATVGTPRYTFVAAWDAFYAYQTSLALGVAGNVVIVEADFNSAFTTFETAIGVFSAEVDNHVNLSIQNLAKDDVISRAEKPVAIKTYATILTEKTALDAKADAYTISRVAYDTSITNLTDYLATCDTPVLWNVLTDITTLSALHGTSGAIFSSKFQDVYVQREALEAAITAYAATHSTWAGIPAGSGKADDNATVGSIVGTNFKDSGGTLVTKVDQVSQDLGTITNGVLNIGTANNVLKFNSTDGMWLGNTAVASAPFSVSIAGVLKAISGRIGAWTLSDTSLYGGAGSGFSGMIKYVDANTLSFFAGATDATGTAATFKVTAGGVLTATGATIGGAISASTIDIGGTNANSFHVDIDGNLWSGDAAFATGKFKVSNAGAMTATTGNILGGFTVGTAGSISSGATAYNTGIGWWLDYNAGNPRFFIGEATGKKIIWDTVGGLQIDATSITSASLNPALQSWTSNIVFSSTGPAAGAWSVGSIKVTSGATYAISAGAVSGLTSLKYVFLDIAASTTVLQTSDTYTAAHGDGRILIATIMPSGDTTNAAIIPFTGQAPLVNGNQLIAGSVTAGQIAAGTITANEIYGTTLEAISADLGTITAGAISGVSIQLGTADGAVIKANTGGLWAGNLLFASAPFRVAMDGSIVATSATITGAITANTGFIGGTGGWIIDANKIYKTKSTFASATSGVYIGVDGINFGDGVAYFKASSAGVVDVAGGSFSGGIITGSVFQTDTGAVGHLQRVVINGSNDNKIKLYNADGVLVVDIAGSLTGSSLHAIFGSVSGVDATPISLRTSASAYSGSGYVSAGVRGHLGFYALDSTPSGSPGTPVTELAAVTDHLEYWSGSAWERVAFISDISAGTWDANTTVDGGTYT